MQATNPNEPVISKHQPMFSIRYILAAAVNQFYEYCIPQTHTTSKVTGRILQKNFGAKHLAMKHWTDFVANATSHLGQKISGAELLYGGDLATDNTVVVGAQIIRTWDPTDGETILLEVPETLAEVAGSPEAIEVVDVTTDPGASTPPPVLASSNPQIPDPDAPKRTDVVADGSPHVPQVLIPVVEGQKITVIETPDPSVHEETAN